METLATNLLALWEPRKTDGLPAQKDVAAKADMDQTTFGRMLRGKHSPTLTQVVKLAAVFGVEPWQLLAPELGVHLFALDNERRVVPVAAPKFDEYLLRRKVADKEDESGNGGEEWQLRKKPARARGSAA